VADVDVDWILDGEEELATAAVETAEADPSIALIWSLVTRATATIEK
jgi:hypothetical protein